MNPGRELDALIAEKVMDEQSSEKVANIIQRDGKLVIDGTLNFPCEPKPYSTDIAAAWQVVEHVRSKTHLNAFSLFSPTDESSKWFAGFDKKWHGRDARGPYELESGETAPHAICLAALKAVGAP